MILVWFVVFLIRDRSHDCCFHFVFDIMYRRMCGMLSIISVPSVNNFLYSKWIYMESHIICYIHMLFVIAYVTCTKVVECSTWWIQSQGTWTSIQSLSQHLFPYFSPLLTHACRHAQAKYWKRTGNKWQTLLNIYSHRSDDTHHKPRVISLDSSFVYASSPGSVDNVIPCHGIMTEKNKCPSVKQCRKITF